MPGDLEIPFAILAIRFDLGSAADAEIFGFFYYQDHVPSPGEPRKLFTWDLLNGRCCQVTLRGSEAQIDALLRVAAVSSGWSFEDKTGIAECIRLAREQAVPFGFDNLEEPTGGGLPIEVPLRLRQDVDEITNRLENLGDELELTLHPDFLPQSAR